jgi:hypothetical protein
MHSWEAPHGSQSHQQIVSHFEDNFTELLILEASGYVYAKWSVYYERWLILSLKGSTSQEACQHRKSPQKMEPSKRLVKPNHYESTDTKG